MLSACLLLSFAAWPQSFTTVALPAAANAANTELTGANASGVLVGHFNIKKLDQVRGFRAAKADLSDYKEVRVRLQNGQFAAKTLVEGVTSSGVIFGSYLVKAQGYASARGFSMDPQGNAITYDNVGISSVAGINDAGRIAGYAVGGGTSEAVVIDGMRVTRFRCGDSPTIVTGVNGKGLVVGYAHISKANFQAFIWDGAKCTTFVKPNPGSGHYDTYATAINDAGYVSGYYKTGRPAAKEKIVAFVWKNGVFHDVTAPVECSQPIPQDINGRGEVLGFCGEPGNPRSFVYRP